MLCDDPDAYGRLLREVMEQAEQRRFEPLPRHVFAFSEAVDAFQLMLQTRHIGKVVLAMGLAGPKVYTVRAGKRFRQLNKYEFVLQPGTATHDTALLKALESGSARIGRIAHLWNVTPDKGREPSVDQSLERSVLQPHLAGSGAGYARLDAPNRSGGPLNRVAPDRRGKRLVRP